MQYTTESLVEYLAGHLRTHAQDYFPEFTGACTVQREPFRGSTSPCFLFRLSEETRLRYVVAKAAPTFPDNNEGLTEFNNLHRFEQGNTRAHLRCPRPLAFLPGPDVLLTERAAGVRLKSLLLRSALTRGNRPDPSVTLAVQRCGEWLRQFHAVHPCHAETVIEPGCLDALVERVKDWAKIDQRPGPLRIVPPVLRAEIAADIASWRTSQPVRFAEQSIEHGDFSFGNVDYHPDYITVFDVCSPFVAPVLRDVANFQTTLAVFLHLRSAPWPVTAFYVNTFMEGYFCGRSLSADEQSLLAVFGMEALIRQARRHVAAISKLPCGTRFLAAPLVRARYRRIVTTLRRRLKESMAARRVTHCPQTDLLGVIKPGQTNT